MFLLRYSDRFSFFESYLQIQSNIHIAILTTEQTAILISASACTLESSVAVQIILHIVPVIEMIADYFAVFPDYNVATVGIVSAIPFLCRSHS